MELKDLIGRHALAGVDFDTKRVEYCGSIEEVDVCRFMLGGVIYDCVQDPNDGYRSSMREIVRSRRRSIKNSFAPVPVFCIHRDSGRNYGSCDILEVYDLKTAKLVLSVGTDNTDDYYPSYVARFSPENLASNVVHAD